MRDAQSKAGSEGRIQEAGTLNPESCLLNPDPTILAVYSEGAGIARAVPRGVAVPRSAEEVEAVVRWAGARGMPLIPRGSGSGMAGGAVGDGIILDVSRLSLIGPVDATAQRVVVGPGALRDDVERAAGAHGLRVPVDPSSGAFCTVGGMAATNAAGAHTLRWGSIRAWVTALDCVFDDGSRAVVRRGAPPPRDVAAVRRFLDGPATALANEPADALAHAGVRKDSSGYALAAYRQSGELVDLLVGSEGTLAVFVGVELALIPLPAATSSLLAEFATLEGAVAAAGRARDAGASACELLDRTFLDVAAEGDLAVDVGASADAVLLIEVEGVSAADAAAQARVLERACLDAGASRVRVALDAATERAVWSLRHAASPILTRLDPALKSMQFIEDGAVPPARLPEYVRGVRRALAERGIRGVIFGHAGDAHVHVNPLVDVSRPDWRERVAGLLDDVVALTARLGGTLSGEHGDGRLRTPLMNRVWPAAVLDRFAQVKSAFDPRGILNPGVKVPLPGQRALGEIKYDPALPALPDAARSALERVERDRLYGESRLELLDSAARPDCEPPPSN